jgi:biopolymer transport protein ExbD
MSPLRRHTQRHPLGVLSELNVTPLLDLSFVLLVIFMITAPLLRQGMELVLPSTKTEQVDQLPEDVVSVSVGADGVLALNGAAVAEAGLTEALRLLREQKESLAVVVETQQTLPVQRLVEILEQVKLAGVSRMGLVTRQQAVP